MTKPLTEAQLAYSRSGTLGMSKNARRAKQQIVSSRQFTYDGSLAPTCLACGAPRENRKAQKCDACAEES